MLAATLCFSAMQVLVKWLDRLPFFELILFRALFSLVASGGTMAVLRLSVRRTHTKWLVLRGLFGAISLSCFFYGLHHAPLASVVTIVNLKPILFLLIASVWLGEKVRPIQWGFLLLSFVGVYLIKGYDPRISTFELLVVVGAAIGAAVAHAIVKRLAGLEPPVVILFYFTVVTVPIYGVYTLFHWSPPTAEEWLLILAMSACTHAGQLFFTKAYQTTRVAQVASFSYLGVIFALASGYWLFDEHYSLIALGGMGLIVCGLLLNLLVKPLKEA